MLCEWSNRNNYRTYGKSLTNCLQGEVLNNFMYCGFNFKEIEKVLKK